FVRIIRRALVQPRTWRLQSRPAQSKRLPYGSGQNGAASQRIHDLPRSGPTKRCTFSMQCPNEPWHMGCATAPLLCHVGRFGLQINFCAQRNTILLATINWFPAGLRGISLAKNKSTSRQQLQPAINRFKCVPLAPPPAGTGPKPVPDPPPNPPPDGCPNGAATATGCWLKDPGAA
ncbi:hypothetical protein Vretimale_18928, partial [Volvox reticuliferus]